MIDAYEIGIQLLLQEDVSAGLAVINRGLAEVDQAIAATSADLVGLIQKAEAATRAVAAGLGGRSVPAAVGTDQPMGVSTEQAARRETDTASVAPPVVMPQVSAAMADVQAAPAIAPAPVPAQLDTTILQEQVPARQEAREPTAPASAPAATDPAGSTADDRGASAPQAEMRAPAPVAPAPVVSAAPGSTNVLEQPASEVATLVQEPRRSATPTSAPLALTASIHHTRRQAASEAHSGRTRHMPQADHWARRERPVAPWSGVDQFGSQNEAARLPERAAAPRSIGQERNDSGGGTVMLDGRLVGQWLSDHMAREASRPPSGTSFFDPRQTPAWNVSGAL